MTTIKLGSWSDESNSNAAALYSYMSLPIRTAILVVGAGPSGLACAISLINQGCRDIVVVDALSQGENTSRALIIQAATLEVRLFILIRVTHVPNVLFLLRLSILFSVQNP